MMTFIMKLQKKCLLSWIAKLLRSDVVCLIKGDVTKRHGGHVEADDRWRATTSIPHKGKMKEDMRNKRRVFDRKVKGAKRGWWLQQQDELLDMQSNNPQGFWKQIGSIGVDSDVNKRIPWEVVNTGGSISRDPNDVLNRLLEII